MGKLRRVEINKLSDMQKLELLHIIQHPFPFSRKYSAFYDETSDQFYLLLVQTENQTSLSDWLENAAEKNLNSGSENNDFIKILLILYRQLLYLEENLFSLNFSFLTTEYLEVSRDLQELLNAFSLEQIIRGKNSSEISACLRWFTIPQFIEKREKSDDEENSLIWHEFSKLDPDHKTFYERFGTLITQAKFAEIPELLQHQRDLLNTSEISEQKSSQDSEQREQEKEDSVRSTSSGTNQAVYKRDKTSLSDKIKSFFYRKKTAKDETTVPLSPQDELYRLAMISEGQPGTLEENEGLRVFILIDEFLIGRDKAICDLILNEKSIGRVHARISRHGSHYFIQDLGSANGTFVDGKKLNKHQTYPLKDFCRLKFAELPFYFTVD